MAKENLHQPETSGKQPANMLTESDLLKYKALPDHKKKFFEFLQHLNYLLTTDFINMEEITDLLTKKINYFLNELYDLEDTDFKDAIVDCLSFLRSIIINLRGLDMSGPEKDDLLFFVLLRIRELAFYVLNGIGEDQLWISKKNVLVEESASASHVMINPLHTPISTILTTDINGV